MIGTCHMLVVTPALDFNFRHVACLDLNTNYKLFNKYYEKTFRNFV